MFSIYFATAPILYLAGMISIRSYLDHCGFTRLQITFRFFPAERISSGTQLATNNVDISTPLFLTNLSDANYISFSTNTQMLPEMPVLTPGRTTIRHADRTYGRRYRLPEAIPEADGTQM